MVHDFDKFPELTNAQLETMMFESPHQQISEDFEATVVKVHDGDTITLHTTFRDFDFPLRLAFIDAPEMNEGGDIARDWLEGKLLGNKINVLMDRHNRVGKFGRLIGEVQSKGINMGNEMLMLGLVKPFAKRDEGKLPDLNQVFNPKQWGT